MKRDYVDVVNFPTGSGSFYLETKEKLASPSANNVKVFKGQGSNSPTYAIIHKEGKSGDFSVKYWFFFPYHRGKRVCAGVEFWGKCLGKHYMIGNHVGDWGHVEVRFRNYNIHSFYLTTDHFDRRFNWDGRTFKHKSDSIQMVGGHPVAYCAQGSHGMWLLLVAANTNGMDVNWLMFVVRGQNGKHGKT